MTRTKAWLAGGGWQSVTLLILALTVAGLVAQTLSLSGQLDSARVEAARSGVANTAALDDLSRQLTEASDDADRQRASLEATLEELQAENERLRTLLIDLGADPEAVRKPTQSGSRSTGGGTSTVTAPKPSPSQGASAGASSSGSASTRRGTPSATSPPGTPPEDRPSRAPEKEPSGEPSPEPRPLPAPAPNPSPGPSPCVLSLCLPDLTIETGGPGAW